MRVKTAILPGTDVSNWPPGIEALNLVIDLPNNQYYLLGIDDQRKVVNSVKMSGKTEENLAATLRQKNPRSRVNMCPENFVVRLTPARAYYINQLNQTRVKLEILGKIKK